MSSARNVVVRKSKSVFKNGGKEPRSDYKEHTSSLISASLTIAK